MIEERLAKVEHELTATKRRYRRLLVVSVMPTAVFCLVSLFGASQQGVNNGPTSQRAESRTAAKVIRANCFIVEDEDGKDRIVLHADEDMARLVFFHGDGTGRAALVSGENATSLQLLERNNKIRIGMNASSLGSELFLNDENDKRRVAISASEVESNLVCNDEKGKAIWSATK